MPYWWQVLSGVFFVLFIIVLLLLTVVAIYLLQAVRQLTKQIGIIGGRVDDMTRQMTGLVNELRRVSGAVGDRTSSLLATANAVANGVSKRMEVVTTLLFAFRAFRAILGSRKR